jgi:hypothetical protein
LVVEPQGCLGHGTSPSSSKGALRVVSMLTQRARLVLGLDKRALSAFRIAYGLLVLSDLWSRWWESLEVRTIKRLSLFAAWPERSLSAVSDR